MGYTPIRINTILPDITLTFDLHIHYKGQYLEYISQGKTIPTALILKLKKQKMARFYILDTQEPEYQEFLDRLLDEALSSDKVPAQEKIGLAGGAASGAIERMKDAPESPSSFKATQKAAQSLNQVVSENPEALKEIFGKASDDQATEDEIIIQHCLQVSALSSKLAKASECTKEQIDDLCTAALLHDLALTKLDPENKKLFFKPFSEMTPEEKKVYTKHPEDVAKILQDKPYINQSILTLIVSHEEKTSGDGYPGHKKKLSLLEEILSLTNAYDKRVTAYKMDHKTAIKEVQVNELGNYNLDLINKLKTILKEDGII